VSMILALWEYPGAREQVGWSWPRLPRYTPAKLMTTVCTFASSFITLDTHVRDTDYANALQCDDSAVSPTL
jgi:hypothetical protein